MKEDYYLNHNANQLNRTISLCGSTCAGYALPFILGYTKEDGIAHDDYIAKGVHGPQHGSRIWDFLWNNIEEIESISKVFRRRSRMDNGLLMTLSYRTTVLELAMHADFQWEADGSRCSYGLYSFTHTRTE